MKTYKILTIAFFSLVAASCKQTLFDDINKAGVEVVENENIKFNGNIVTVKKGTPVDFNLAGEPDYITFYSGELGHQYIYRERMDGDVNDVLSARLKFRVWAQYGVAKANGENSAEGQMSILYVTENSDGTPVFPGLSRDFEKDSVMVEQEIPWKNLVDQKLMPNKGGDIYSKYDPSKPNAYFSCNDIDVDLTSYLGKKLTMALVFNKDKREAPLNSATNVEPGTTILQSTFHFEDMYIETKWKNGRITRSNADAFGFTPVNMKNKTVFEDHEDNQYQMPSDLEYGSVKANVEGFWNLNNIDAGKIDISGCGANFKWKYSWLISDYLNLASVGEPDRGMKIKDINLPVASYQHTYNEVGTYKATFVMTNQNYDDSQQKVCEFVINVVESL